MSVRNLFVFGSGLILIAVVWWFWPAAPLISMGNSVPVHGGGYRHLTYNKLSADHNGNFTGDVYLVNVATEDKFQLTKGGTTASAAWLNNQELLVSYRPKGSVVEPYYLDVSTGRLSAADHHVSSLPFYKDRFDAGLSPTRSHYTVHIPNGDNAQADRYAVLGVTQDGAEIIATISTLGFSLPSWLPKSEGLIYGRYDKQMCLLNLRSLGETCRPGMSPVASKTRQPEMVAFLDVSEGGFKVCTAEIEAFEFSNVTCHDESPRQITNLSWRP